MILGVAHNEQHLERVIRAATVLFMPGNTVGLELAPEELDAYEHTYATIAPGKRLEHIRALYAIPIRNFQETEDTKDLFWFRLYGRLKEQQMKIVAIDDMDRRVFPPLTTTGTVLDEPFPTDTINTASYGWHLYTGPRFHRLAAMRIRQTECRGAIVGALHAPWIAKYARMKYAAPRLPREEDAMRMAEEAYPPLIGLLEEHRHEQIAQRLQNVLRDLDTASQ